jgi:hypothetical protein
LNGVETTGSKRRWFQLHLSTAIILMFAAGFFLYLNCRKLVYQSGYYICGWPEPFYYSGGFQQSLSYHLGPFEPVLLLINILFALILLAEIAFICEAVNRRTNLAYVVIVMIEIAVFGYLAIVTFATLLSPYIGELHPK